MSVEQQIIVEQMAAQNQVLTALTEKITQLTTQNNQLTNQNSRFEAEINKLKTTPKFNSSKTQFDETDSIRQKLSYFQTSAKPIEPKPEWELNKYGKPFRCRKCGLLGHKDQNCKGTL